MEALKSVISGSSDKQKNTSEFIVDDAKPGNFITTNFGVRINDTDNSLKAGARGPTILDDFHFREKITHFDHERIPERVVHARGTGVHGYFECAESLQDICMADFLSAAGKRTPVFVRFSTVLGSRGSADTVRDVRGFAMKFYTQDGNFDIVGNNIPVFFIQDAIKFPDVIHAGKPNPVEEVPQASSAHDNFWDFMSLTPETAHMVMWALSDRAVPRSYRMMQGFGVHTFIMYNKMGQRKFVKFHLTPKLGVHSLIWDEAVKIQGADADFHRNDLYEAITSGRYPEYDVSIQILNESDEDKFDFDILDATKLIPEEFAPLKKIGTLVLNRNPDNFFSEVEQVAFCTQHLVPGIAPSDDPLLQGRMFSYLDTQISRLGGPNFEEIPINRPVCPVTNNQRDGMHRMAINKPIVNYFPNRFGCPHLASLDNHGYIHPPTRVAGEKIRARGPKFAEHFNQARLFYNSLSPVEQEHLTNAAIFELSNVEDQGVRDRMINIFNKINHELALKVAPAIGVKPPALDESAKYDKKSPPLSQMYYNKANTIDTRAIAFVVGPGFNAAQVKFLTALLTAGHAIPEFIGPHKGDIPDNAGGSVKARFSYTTTKSVLYDAVIVVGGKSSIETIESYGENVQFLNEAFKHAKAIIALDEAVDVVAGLNFPDIKVATSNDPFIVSHGVVTTKKFDDKDKSAEQDNTPGFGRAVFEAIAAPRHYERNVKKVPC